jgi:hypothetical protein
MASTGAAQNLVTNGQFHTDINGWALLGSGSQAWDPLDCDGNPSSGSLRVMATVAGPPASTTSQQCIPVSPSGTYELGGHIRFPSGQGAGGIAAVGLRMYANLTCTPPWLALTQTATVSSQTTDTWVKVFASGLNLAAGTVAVGVDAAVGLSGGPSLSALFDRMRFGLDGTTPAQLQDFTVE